MNVRNIRLRPSCQIAVCVCIAALSAGLATGQTVGEPLPGWAPGYLDIHFINTGRGDAALLVFPDGTSLQVDAGDGGWDEGPPRGVVRKPNDSRTAGEWLARYAARALAHDSDPKIDYAFLTHLHSDHMAGFEDLAANIPIGKMVDRGWPDYDYPVPVESNSEATAHIAFLKRASNAGTLQVEKLRPGRNDQIVLLRDRQAYPNFEVRNIAANGVVWTGLAENTRQHFPVNYRDLPKQDWPSENQCSSALRISYGAFDFYTGGDMPGQLQPGQPQWMDLETAVAKAVGPVEIAAANHHGNRDSTNAFFVESLRPRFWILQVWSSDHPGHDVLARMLSKRLYPDDRFVLATNMPVANRQVIGPLLDELLSSQGHIVVRVEPGGQTFRVLILEDSDESMRVKAVFGPFTSR